MRPILWGLPLLALVALAGTAAACEGLSPGDQLQIDGATCTLGFLLADPNGLYFSTAGHCIQVDQKASASDFGNFGVGVFHFLEPETGDVSDGAPGYDFGLIRVNTDVYPSLNPKMCGWDGPVGMYEGGAEGGEVHHYGHGVLFGDLGPTTQKRQGFFLRTTEDAFYWTGMGVMGDSGSAVMSEDNRAVGIFTHAIFGVMTEDNGGTTLQRGLALASEAGFTQLRLVLAGEDPVAVMEALRNAPPPPPATEEVPPTPDAQPSSETPPQEGEKPPPAEEAPPANETPPVVDDSISPAATSDDAPRDKVPAPAILVILALALAPALARAKRKG